MKKISVLVAFISLFMSRGSFAQDLNSLPGEIVDALSKEKLMAVCLNEADGSCQLMQFYYQAGDSTQYQVLTRAIHRDELVHQVKEYWSRSADKTPQFSLTRGVWGSKSRGVQDAAPVYIPTPERAPHESKISHIAKNVGVDAGRVILTPMFFAVDAIFSPLLALDNGLKTEGGTIYNRSARRFAKRALSELSKNGTTTVSTRVFGKIIESINAFRI